MYGPRWQKWKMKARPKPRPWKSRMKKLEAKLDDDGEVSEALEALGQATSCQVPSVAVGEATGSRGVHGRAS